MSRLIDDCSRRFEESAQRFETEFSVLDAALAACRPAPKSWSVAECIDHLCASLELYADRLEPALECAGVAAMGNEPGRGTLAGRLLTWAMDPSRARPLRLKVPPGFRRNHPTQLRWEALVDRYPQQCARWQAILAQAEGKPLSEIVVTTPVSRWLKVSAAQALRINAWHQGRHLDQAEGALRVVQAPRA